MPNAHDGDHKKSHPKIIRSFLQGLLVLLPIYLTFWLVFIIVRWAYRFLSVFRKLVPFLPETIKNFRYTDEILTLIIFVFIFFLIALYRSNGENPVRQGFHEIRRKDH